MEKLTYIYISRFKNPPSALSLFREASFGHGRLRIVNETHAHWSWQRNNDSNSVVADQVWFQSLSSSKACWPDVDDQGLSSSTHKEEL